MDNQHLYHELYDVLRMEDRYCTDAGELIKSNIQEDALNLAPSLLKLLLANESLKRHFFRDVDGIRVFDKVAFQKLIMNKQFLPDSYTAYKNKIGLTTDDGRFITDSREVVLAWPYKDCMLEGGQTKEEAKRDEVFWNETLAPDEINRLTEPKMLTNFRRHDKDGEHNVEHLSPNDNLIIKGNNLLALHSLKEKYAGQVKLIYIDPPYNTGNDSFGYNDNFNHSTWLTFMKNRLIVAKELLKDSGLLFVHIDDIESAYLKVLSDNVFGRENFMNVIAVKSSTPSGTKTAHKDKTIIKQKDLILVYKNGGETKLCPQYTKRKGWDQHYSLLLDKNESGNFYLRSLQEELISLGIIGKDQTLRDINIEDKRFKEYYLANRKSICRLQSHKNKKAEIASRALVNAVYEDKEDEEIKGLYYNGQVITTLAQGIKLVYSNQQFVEDLGMLLCDFWDDIDFQNTQNEGGISFPTAKKPELLLYRIISLCTLPGDIVLDFFLGSGTTAAVAHKMGRQYIGIEQMDYGKNDSVVRLCNVINGDKSGASKGLNWQGGGSFVYCELSKYNQNFIDEIEEAKTTDELMVIWKRMQETGFLSYQIKAKDINIDADEFKDLSIDDQKRFLIECLDKNLLYIPFSEIDNEEYNISDEDKRLTREFYKKG